VIALLVGVPTFIITRMVIAHRERMAKIQQGMDPDHSPDKVRKDRV